MKKTKEKDKWPVSQEDVHLFNQGTNYRAYNLFGAHLKRENDVDGVRFTVWAPNADKVYLIGMWNQWLGTPDCEMKRLGHSGVWTIFKPELAIDTTYKYEIHSKTGVVLKKADPYAFFAELRPDTASKVANIEGYEWSDTQWYADQKALRGKTRPINIYEVHMGSWKRHDDGQGLMLSYRELADDMVPYVKKMGYTHIEVMPINEHPLDASWGYQATGYYAASARFGHPKDFMYFVDQCHQNGIGVLMDWVPGHYCRDAHGLYYFDGTPTYEWSVPWRADNNEWGTANFDHGKPEVQCFLISNAIFWMEKFHVDGLRVDAVANMLYLSFNKKEGEWEPNIYGGKENIESVAFLRKMNEVLHKEFPDILTMAEESTEWPQVTRPTYIGGLGFDYKWNMGWMNDTLKYIKMDPIYRRWHHNLLTFSMMYAFSENFVLPLSHDEVVHGKYSLVDKQNGDYWRKFAGLRSMFGYMMTLPGKKLLFMGGEFGQFVEWRFAEGLEWKLCLYDKHRQLQDYVRELNHIYLEHKCLWEIEQSWDGFSWVDANDAEGSTLSYLRLGKDDSDFLVVITNFTPVVREGYKLDVPGPGEYEELINSDWEKFGGSDIKNSQKIETEKHDFNADAFQIKITVPPLATVIFKPKNIKRVKPEKLIVAKPQVAEVKKAKDLVDAKQISELP
ncbi:MAG: 1,4-alpha-glucan branching protein GlgB [Bacillota bacterium]